MSVTDDQENVIVGRCSAPLFRIRDTRVLGESALIYSNLYKCAIRDARKKWILKNVINTFSMSEQKSQCYLNLLNHYCTFN